MSPLDSLRELGTAPDPDEVDRWLIEQGLIRHIVGKSFLGRDLVAYTTEDPNVAGAPAVPDTSMLYISLVHGNEPTGLLALLSAVEKLVSSRHDHPSSFTNLIFFPFVNIDSYLVNLPIAGCRRTNLHIDDLCNQAPISEVCPSSTASGVDINRNFPADWEPTLNEDTLCSPVHPGPAPFSEPETQAIRNVVTIFQPTHMMSFHSRTDARSGPRLLIHPYGSDLRSLARMDPVRRANYRRWNTELLGGARKDYGYVAGTAAETIGYTARGTTLDWMERVHDVYSYVVEVVPPLEDSRWCEDAEDACWSEVDVHADTAVLWLDLIVAEHNESTSDEGRGHQQPSIVVEPSSRDSVGLGGGNNAAGVIDTSTSWNTTTAVLLSLSFVLFAAAGVVFFLFRKRRLAGLRRHRIDYCTPPVLLTLNPTTTQPSCERTVVSGMSSWGGPSHSTGRACSELTQRS